MYRKNINLQAGGIWLRKLTHQDGADYFNLLDRNREFLTHHGEITGGKYKTVEEVYDSILFPDNPQKLRIGIWVDRAFAGSINLTPNKEDSTAAEIGYWLGNEYTGRNIATRAARKLIEYAFTNLGFSRIFAYTGQHNIGSMKVLLSAGLHMDQCPGRQKKDRYYFSLTQKNWLTRKEEKADE